MRPLSVQPVYSCGCGHSWAIQLHQPKSRPYAAKALSAERPQQSAVVAYCTRTYSLSATQSDRMYSAWNTGVYSLKVVLRTPSAILVWPCTGHAGGSSAGILRGGLRRCPTSS
jgi:hypothetical protein